MSELIDRWLPGLATYFLPWWLAVFGLLVERWAAHADVNPPWGREQPLGLLLRWGWRLALFAVWAFRPDAGHSLLTLYVGVSPAVWVNQVLVTLGLAGGTWLAWVIAAPQVPNSQNTLAGLPDHRFVRGLARVLDALTWQMVFALVRLPALGHVAGTWVLVAATLLATASAVWVSRAAGTVALRREDLVFWTHLIGGTGLALATQTLWSPLLWSALVALLL